MKILTSLTIILTIPTIVGSIYGMNIKLPIAERDDAFIWLVLLTLFICIVTTYYLKGKFYKSPLVEMEKIVHLNQLINDEVENNA